LPDINWGQPQAFFQPKSSDFVQFCCKCGLEQISITPTSKNKILDLVLTDDPLIISYMMVCPPFSSSDHDSIVVSIVLPTNSNIMAKSISSPINSLPRYDWSRADWLNLSQLFSSLDWFSLFNTIIDPNAD